MNTDFDETPRRRRNRGDNGTTRKRHINGAPSGVPPVDSSVCSVGVKPEREPFWTGPGYRDEYNCPHGVGHGNHVHGCDGCCQRDDFPLNKKNLAKTRAAEILRGVGPFRVIER